jgi:hypothetical protein
MQPFPFFDPIRMLALLAGAAAAARLLAAGRPRRVARYAR